MKNVILFLIILIFATPAFAVPGWKDGMNDNVQYYDDSAATAYRKKLEDAYYKKYPSKLVTRVGADGEIIQSWSSSAPMDAYEREVEAPFNKFRQENPVDYTKTVKGSPFYPYKVKLVKAFVKKYPAKEGTKIGPDGLPQRTIIETAPPGAYQKEVEAPLRKFCQENATDFYCKTLYP